MLGIKPCKAYHETIGTRIFFSMNESIVYLITNKRNIYLNYLLAKTVISLIKITIKLVYIQSLSNLCLIFAGKTLQITEEICVEERFGASYLGSCLI